MPRTIEQVDVARDGGLVSITQLGTLDQRGPQEPIPVEHLVAYVYKKEGGNWLGRSILRGGYKNWLIKDRLMRVQAQTIERNGMGIPDYEGAESETDLGKGLALATSLRAGEAAGVARPSGSKLRLMGVEGELPDALPVIKYHDEQIARGALAHFLNLDTQSHGSYALGASYMDFFTLSLQALAQSIANTATMHIVEDLVDLNFGEGEPAPRLVFDEIGSKQAATAVALKTLVDAGILHPDEVLEESSRQQYGLPPADPATATVPPAPSGGVPQAPTQTGDMSVAAAMADPKGVAAGAADLDEEADDWEDAIDALIQALAELAGGYVEAAWDPAKHARNPKGSPGGGRFRSMVDRLKDAITGHQKGGGKGHPFEGFDREQLRRTARARGIELKRGEDRDSIAKKLLERLGGAKSAPPPKAKGGGWREESVEKLIAERVAQVAEQWRALDAQIGESQPDSYYLDAGRRTVAHELNADSKIFTDGTSRLVDKAGTTDPAVLDAAMRQTEALVGSNPLPHGVTVTFVGKKLAGGSSAAITTDEGKSIMLAPEVDLRDPDPVFDGGFMPEKLSTKSVRYVITHEYGHALMFQHGHGGKARRLYGEKVSGMSFYGESDYLEAYAEAFAEWALSGGKTTNVAARRYAEEFGWQA
jgi:hypothetical protein